MKHHGILLAYVVTVSVQSDLILLQQHHSVSKMDSIPAHCVHWVTLSFAETKV